MPENLQRRLNTSPTRMGIPRILSSTSEVLPVKDAHRLLPQYIEAEALHKEGGRIMGTFLDRSKSQVWSHVHLEVSQPVVPLQDIFVGDAFVDGVKLLQYLAKFKTYLSFRYHVRYWRRLCRRSRRWQNFRFWTKLILEDVSWQRSVTIRCSDHAGQSQLKREHNIHLANERPDSPPHLALVGSNSGKFAGVSMVTHPHS